MASGAVGVHPAPRQVPGLCAAACPWLPMRQASIEACSPTALQLGPEGGDMAGGVMARCVALLPQAPPPRLTAATPRLTAATP
jgi:hypothetical protein